MSKSSNSGNWTHCHVLCSSDSSFRIMFWKEFRTRKANWGGPALPNSTQMIQNQRMEVLLTAAASLPATSCRSASCSLQRHSCVSHSFIKGELKKIAAAVPHAVSPEILPSAQPHFYSIKFSEHISDWKGKNIYFTIFLWASVTDKRYHFFPSAKL